MKTLLLAIALMLFIGGMAQPLNRLSLSEARNLAARNYPAIKRKDLVRQTADINIANLSKGFLPQVNLLGQASYQSEVTRIPVSLPGLNFDPPSKDQYKVVADLNQLVFDGGITKAQQAWQRQNAAVEDQKIEVELYQVRERINDLYLGILLIDQQLIQVRLLSADISIGIKRVEAQVNNGTSFRSNLNLLKAELLKAGQKTIELTATRKGLLDALALFLGQELPENLTLEMPVSENGPASIERPELKLFEQQSALVSTQEKMIQARNLPKTSLFAQGGYGRPALNMLKNDFAFYYIAGVRLNWALSGFYSRKKDRELLQVNKKMIATQQESFLLNTNALLKQQAAEISKVEKLLEADKDIIELRHAVTEAAKAQLENGVITANDYLNQVNAEDQARQQKLFHDLQLVQARIKYNSTAGTKE